MWPAIDMQKHPPNVFSYDSNCHQLDAA
ncbi:hypothetical protein XFF6970_1020090 [Xanthomonas citri pv. fuscans]|nr:hypothetical protein XFF6970_1020090 [Xanthomonas citri pv. fuscans]